MGFELPLLLPKSVLNPTPKITHYAHMLQVRKMLKIISSCLIGFKSQIFSIHHSLLLKQKCLLKLLVPHQTLVVKTSFMFFFFFFFEIVIEFLKEKRV